MPDSARIGIVGCGAICDTYLRGIAEHPQLTVVACADRDPARAGRVAAAAGVRALATDDLITAADVDVVLNITNPAAHAGVTAAAIAAGKDVYVEKPFALQRADGVQLVESAQRAGVLVGAAPDTFLSPALQTCGRLVDEGALGTPVAATAELVFGGHESWHPDPAFYYHAGGGPLFDMGPYYLTALVAMLGPVRRVAASARQTFATRTITSDPRRGESIAVEVPTHVSAVLDFVSGAVGALTMSFDIAVPSRRLVVHGTDATLECPDPNTFDGPVRLRTRESSEWETVPELSGEGARMRGFGLADMVAARAQGRQPRASAQLALHVLDIMQACHDSSETGHSVELTTACERPAPLVAPTGVPPAGW